MSPPPGASSLRVAPTDCKVDPKNLPDLNRIHALLAALNDPYASGTPIAKLVEQIPVLAARCVVRARSAKAEITSVDHALRLIGNRGLEVELLNLLEDLTVAKAEREEG